MKKINKNGLKAGVMLISAAILFSGVIATTNLDIEQIETVEIESVEEELTPTAMNGDAAAYIAYDNMEWTFL